MELALQVYLWLVDVGVRFTQPLNKIIVAVPSDFLLATFPQTSGGIHIKLTFDISYLIYISASNIPVCANLKHVG